MSLASKLVVYMPPGTHLPEDNNVMAHGNSLTSKQVVPSGALDLDQPLWSVFCIIWMLVTNCDFGKFIDVFI